MGCLGRRDWEEKESSQTVFQDWEEGWKTTDLLLGGNSTPKYCPKEMDGRSSEKDISMIQLKGLDPKHQNFQPQQRVLGPILAQKQYSFLLSRKNSGLNNEHISNNYSTPFSDEILGRENFTQQ